MHDSILTTLTCPTASCRITFEVPAGLKNRAIRDGQTVFCPNGHRIIWPKQSDLDVERKNTEHERKVKSRYQDLFHDAAAERNELLRLVRTCPACGWRSKRRIVEKIRADFAQHLSEQHGLAITEELEESLT